MHTCWVIHFFSTMYLSIISITFIIFWCIIIKFVNKIILLWISMTISMWQETLQINDIISYRCKFPYIKSLNSGYTIHTQWYKFLHENKEYDSLAISLFINLYKDVNMTEVFTTSEKVFPPGTAVTRAPVHQTESYAIWPTALNVCTVVNGRLHNAVISVLFVFWGRTIHASKFVAESTVQNNANASILSFSYVYYFFLCKEKNN